MTKARKCCGNCIKFIIVPDYVISKYDKQRHWISAGQLMRLYNVKPQDCYIWNIAREKGYPDNRDLIVRNMENSTILYPRYSGDYTDYGNQPEIIKGKSWKPALKGRGK